MNYPKKVAGIDPTALKEIFIQQEQPENPPDQAIWIKVDESSIPSSVYRYSEDTGTWIELNVLEQNIVVSKEEPSNKYPNLVWFELDDSNSVSSIKVWIEEDWKEVSSTSSSVSGFDTYKVKATETDSVPGYLSDKVDNTTIQVASNQLAVKFQDDKEKDVVWSSQRVTREAIIKAIIFG